MLDVLKSGDELSAIFQLDPVLFETVLNEYLEKLEKALMENPNLPWDLKWEIAPPNNSK